MKTLRFIFSLLILVGCCKANAAPPSTVPSLPNIPAPLRWAIPPESWSLQSQALKIVAGPRTNWFISPIDADAVNSSPKLVFPANDDFSLSAKVTVDFRSTWDAGVLVVYGDDKTWAKLCFEQTVDQHPAIVSVVTEGTSDDNTSVPISGNTVWLKIAKTGPALFFYFSNDGRTWKLIRSFRFHSSPALQIGFSSQSPTGTQCAAIFSEIQYSPKRIASFWKGE